MKPWYPGWCWILGVEILRSPHAQGISRSVVKHGDDPMAQDHNNHQLDGSPTAMRPGQVEPKTHIERPAFPRGRLSLSPAMDGGPW